MIRNVDVALATANLLNLGYPDKQAAHLAIEWRAIQVSRTVGRISHYAKNVPVLRKGAELQAGRLYLSGHLSSYAHIYREVALNSRDSTVVSLIGEQAPQHLDTLQRLAASFGFNIAFVQSSSAMIKTMRRALRSGLSAIVLIDLPWSRRAATPDRSFATPIGEMRTLTTLLRLMDLIDTDFRLIYASREAEGLTIDCTEGATFEHAFAELGRRIGLFPADYERLPHLHRICRLPHSASKAVTFHEANEAYTIHAATMKVYKLSGAAKVLAGSSQPPISISPC